MASAFSHAIAALAIGKVYTQNNLSIKTATIGMVCSVIPDLDAIGYWMGVPYESVWGHRGITHSFFFAMLFSLAVIKVLYPAQLLFSKIYWLKWIYFFAATSSHGILDAITNGGLGVAFFAPFENSRYFFPFRPVQVSQISITGFFSTRGVTVLQSEIMWIWLPSLILIGCSFLMKKIKYFDNGKI